MRMIAGRKVFTELSEIAAPEHTALIVVDMQRDYLCAEGSIAAQKGVNDMVRHRDEIIGKVGRLVESARANRVLVIFIQQSQLPGLLNESPAWMNVLYERQGLSPDIDRCREKTWGWEIVPELAPLPGETVVRKWRSTAFAGTNLDIILSANAIRTTVVCGLATDGCVKATALHAFFNDYYVVLPFDGVGAGNASSHDAALAYMNNWTNAMPTVGQLTAIWDGAGAAR